MPFVKHRPLFHQEWKVAIDHVDKRSMQFAVINFVDKACKYSPSNTTAIIVDASCTKHAVLIEVTDEGLGIANDLLDKVFDATFRIHLDRPVLGVGLGLPFVHKIVVPHGGKLTAAHNPQG